MIQIYCYYTFKIRIILSYISLLKIYVIQYQIMDAYDCLVRQVKYLFSCMATVVMA